MPVTRINNNQISDASSGNVYVGINAAGKLQSYSITSTKIANNLVYGSDLTVTGNLTVQGNTTTIDTVNVVVEDPLLLLASAQTGTPALDIGFIGKRGTEDNIAFVWDEANTVFVTAFTTSEVTNTTISINSYASLKTFDATVTGNLDVTGTTGLTGNTTVGNFFVNGQKTIDVGNSIIGNVQDPIANSDAATKAYVDSVSSSGFTIEDDTANTTVVSGGDTLVLNGTANEVTVAITATDTITFGLPDDVTVAGNLGANNATITNSLGAVSITASGNLLAANVNSNAAVTGVTGVFTGNVSAGNVSATGNVTGGNLLTSGSGGAIVGTGNITGGNLITLGNVNAGNLNTEYIYGATTISLNPGSGNVNVNSKNINNLAAPVADADAATKLYVDTVAQGLDIKASVVFATAANIFAQNSGYTYNNGTSGVGATLTAQAVGNLTIDGNVVAAGERVLIKNETGAYVNDTTQSAAFNGIYVVTTAGSPSAAYVLTRTTDFDNGSPSGEIPGAFTFVEKGATEADTGWVCTTNAPVTMGTTQIIWTQFSGAGSYTAGNGLSLSGTQFNVNVDPETTAINGSNQVAVKAGANLTTPNIGNATGNSLTLGGNGLIQATTITASGNITGGNLVANTGVSAVTGYFTGNVDVLGNLNATIGIVYANSAIFLGDLVTGNNAAFAGIPNYTPLGSNVVMQFAGNVNSYSQLNFQNINDGTLASTDLVLTANNGDDSTYFINMGIAGNNHSDPDFFGDNTSYNDGYLYVVGNSQTGIDLDGPGNLILGATNGDVKIFTGNTAQSNVVATFYQGGVTFNQGGRVQTTGNVAAGNVIVTGQVRVSGNTITSNVQANVEGHFANVIITQNNIESDMAVLTINGFGLNQDTSIGGQLNPNVFYVDAGTNTVSVGSNLQTTGAIAAFNATNSILLPVGNTTERPGTGVTGMFRFNTTENKLEVFDNSTWVPAGSEITVIVADSFQGNGVATNFTLSQDSTTAASIVSINGIVQIPSTAYSISGNVLSFTEPPETSDEIDVRILTTTTTVLGLVNASGNASIYVSETDAQVDIEGNLIPISNLAYSLGNATNQWSSLHVGGNTIYLGNIQLKAVNGQMAFYAENGTTPATIAASSVDTTTIANGTSAVAVISSGGNIRANVAGSTVGLFSSTGLTVTGSITATNGFVGLDATKISNGTSEMSVVSSGGNLRGNVGGSTVFVVSSAGGNITGTFGVSGNANTGNLGATNVVATNLTGTLQTAAQTNITSVGTLSALSVSGNITPGGIAMATGNATIGNLYVSGVATIAGNIQQISGNSGQFFGNATTGFNALYAGLPAGFTILPQSVTNFVSTFNGYSQINNQNQNGGNEATTDYILTSNNGDDSTFYVDLGIASSGYNGAVAVLNNALGNVVNPNDGYLYVTGNVAASNPSDFVFATPDAGSQIRFAVAGSNIANISMKVNAPNTAATSNTTGTLNVLGGIGLSGAVWATGNITGGNLSGTSIVGTLTTAAQTNITSVGTLGSLSVTGNITGGNLSVSTGSVTLGSIVNANANGVGNIGSSSGYFNTVFAKATSAQYADLAEMYEADQIIEPGTVVCFGGDKEVTVCAEDSSRRIAGVVSTNPSYIMNAGLAGDYVTAVALTGRVPTKVTGVIRKGDMLVATGDGRARAEADPKTGAVIGKALADFDGADGVIEVVVGRL